MHSERKTTIIIVGIVLVTLIICGFLGYMNDTRRATTEPSSTPESESPINLTYCYTDALGLCIVSFGSDSAGNTLIVIRNSDPALAEFYLKITAADFRGRYECQQVRFSPDTFYCFGNQISDGSMVTIEVYLKNDNRLIASGTLLVSIGATPMPEITNTPFSPTVSSMPTVTLGTKTPSYPNPTSYPNPSSYPNP